MKQRITGKDLILCFNSHCDGCLKEELGMFLYEGSRRKWRAGGREQRC